MQLTLLRHAIAADGADDFARPLTREGRARFITTVKTLKRLRVRFASVLHSPTLRTTQTAALLSPVVDGEFTRSDLLMKPPTRALLHLLGHDGLAVVGHEPHLSSLLAWLVTGDAKKGARFELKKGAVARLEGHVEPGGMQLTALWTPKVLRLE